MNPNDRLFDKIKVTTAEQNIEECFAKMRYKERREEENKKKEERGESSEEKAIIDKEKKIINFNNKRATSMKCNKRVHIIEPNDDELETKREYLKLKLIESYSSYIENNCDKKGNLVHDNISREDKYGMDKLASRANSN